MLLTAFAVFQLPSCEMLPTRKMFCIYSPWVSTRPGQSEPRGLGCRRLTSPKVVVAVSAKVTVTEPELPLPLPEPEPVPVAPVWMARELLAGTVAENEPPETVNLRMVNSSFVQGRRLREVLTRSPCRSRLTKRR